MNCYSFLVVLLVAFGVAESQRRILISYPQMNNTPSGLFNYQIQKCCLGTIHESLKADYQKCCGEDVYDSSKQRCCQSTVMDLAPASACCGNGTINTDQSICCEGQKVDVPLEDASLVSYAKCCGKSHYDIRTQTCCSTASGMKILDGENKLCCGEEVYEEGTQVCCTSYKNGTTIFKVVPKDGDKTLCCGDAVLDVNTEYCCDGKAVNLDGCCGNKAFNTSTHICCNNEDLIEKTSPDMQCCGKYSYTEKSHLCCYDLYNASLVLAPKSDSNQTICCGLEPFDPEKEICCYETEKIIVKQNKDDYQCCGELSYNSAKQQCCGGKPVDRGTSICCADVEVYDPNTKICCTKNFDNGTAEAYAIVDNPDSKLSCCGLETYDLTSKMCCGNTLVPASPNSGCCGENNYDFNKEVCCTEIIFPKQSGQNSCCFYGTTDARPEYSNCYPADVLAKA